MSDKNKKGRIEMKRSVIAVLLMLTVVFSVSAVSKQADSFSLNDLSGKKVLLAEQKGKVVVLNFFATWCPPCKQEMPSVQRLFNKMKGKKFALLAVSVDRTSTDSLKKFMKENGYTFPVLHDKEGQVSNMYGVMGIPTTLIINKKGEIVDKVVGAKEWDSADVISQLDGLISKK